MKIFTSKSFTNKFIISIVCVILLNFCIAPCVKAETSFGGKMMSIIRDFVTAVADVAASLVQLGVTGEWMYAVDKEGSGEPENQDEYWIDKDKFRYPILQISPEVIFANKVEMLDANFISPVNDKTYDIDLKNDAPLKQLRNIIAGWYVTLRTIAVVGLLSVLIYIGIRIIISSTSGDKAKYKERLMDWVVAFCLLFFMHYIMAGVVTIVEKANDMLNATAGGTQGLDLVEKYGGVEYYEGGTDEPYIPPSQAGLRQYELRERAKKYIETIAGGTASGGSWSIGSPNGSVSILVSEAQISVNGKNYIVEETQTIGAAYDGSRFSYKFKEEGGSYIDITDILNDDSRFEENGEINSDNESGNESGGTTDSTIKNVEKDGRTIRYIDGEQILYFTNYARLYLNVADDDNYLPMSTAYLIIYIALVAFTAVFTIRYIKRVIYIAFLTLMAPMVALTYPLDKIKDRKSTSMEYVV